MADVLVDLALATGLNDGTTWANAYQSLETALDDTNAAPGDLVYVKGSGTVGSTVTLKGGDKGHPVIVLGCKSATTNEPPVQSDLIPGWRTGESRTVANLAHADGDIPHFDVTTGDINITKWFYIYGIHFEAEDDVILHVSTDGDITMEECLLDPDDDFVSGSNSTGIQNKTAIINCEWTPDEANDRWQLLPHSPTIIRGLILTTGAILGSFIGNGVAHTGNKQFEACDLSDRAHTLIALNFNVNSIVFKNCALNASSSITSGTNDGPYRIELYHCDSTTGKSSGTILSYELATANGNIVEETTAVRTGGANDGSSNWALAFTPAIDRTRDQYHALIGPEMAFKITGDGTAQTVSVSIANSGAADYNNDDVWLEVIYPSEGGTAQYDNQTTQMDLLGTPAAIADDTGSTWGTGGNNHQTLSVGISPDYVGRAYCRVVFAKHFGSSPETLYVDPLPVVS